MSKQSDLFRPMCAEHFEQQGDLFPGEPASDLRCGVCGENLVHTESGYLACPRGHGRLLVAREQPDDDIDDATLFAEAAEVHRAKGEWKLAEQFEQLAYLARN